MIEIIIGLVLWMIIGVSAAWRAYSIWSCFIGLGFWYFLLLLIFNWGWISALMTIGYILVVVGSIFGIYDYGGK